MLKVVISGKDKIVVRMAGKINELSDLHLVSVPQADAVEVDMIDITSINSIGIRQFRDWTLGIKSQVLTFSYCPRVFIDQVNMITDFLPPHSRILSFYVPYYNEDSNESKSVLYTRGDQFSIAAGKVEIKWPVVQDSRGKDMEIDVLSEKFFNFLKRY